MNKLVESVLVFIPLSVLLILAIAYISGEVWAKAKIILGDILKLIGWTGIGVRKLSVKSEYEGTINSIIQDYNKNFETSILPNCKIEWVNSDNKQNILKENQAIICLSFDQRDHNLNFYNATLNFVQTALIAKAKDYLMKHSAEAIDLLTTHIILRNHRKEVLSIFRKKLNDFDDATKQEFEYLVPTNDRGLFLHMLLPEFHFYGDLIDTLPPSKDFSIEANGLLVWFKELATREFDERTNLKYISKNLKVGVILVGKDETWENQGLSAYTKWADFYSSENYNSVYVLARGSNGYERATSVTKALINAKGFDQLNRSPIIKCATVDGKEYIVTCYSLRPNKAAIAYLAWENLKAYYSENKDIPAIIHNVQQESIIVNAFGLKFEVPNNYLSEVSIIDARKVFHSEDEIFLKIIELDADKQHVLLTSKGTISDPKHYIDTVLKENKVYSSIVEKIQTDRQGLQSGIMVSNPELKSWIYIPKNKATPSRFLDLSIKFSIGQHLNVIIENYNAVAARFNGSIENLENPWETNKINEITHGDIVTTVVKQINEFSIICEIAEGLECRLVRQEISWNTQDCDTSKYKIDEEIQVMILAVDVDRKRIDVSVKRLTKTPELEYFEANFDKVMEVSILRIVPEKGLVIKYQERVNTGFIYWYEIAWGASGKLENIFQIGDKINALVYDFDAEKNNIRFSIKRQYTHQFFKWLSIIDSKRPVKGKVIQHFDNSAQIELTQKGHTIQAFILKKFVSNYAFVEKEDLAYFLPIGSMFSFYILEINEERETVSLSRKEFLKHSGSPNYGDTINARYVKGNTFKAYFYSDTVEGWMTIPEYNIQLGSKINVLPVSLATGEYTITD